MSLFQLSCAPASRFRRSHEFAARSHLPRNVRTSGSRHSLPQPLLPRGAAAVQRPVRGQAHGTKAGPVGSFCVRFALPSVGATAQPGRRPMKLSTFLALIGFFAIVGAIALSVYFFGGYYSVAATAEEPAIVKW